MLHKGTLNAATDQTNVNVKEEIKTKKTWERNDTKKLAVPCWFFEHLQFIWIQFSLFVFSSSKNKINDYLLFAVFK